MELRLTFVRKPEIRKQLEGRYFVKPIAQVIRDKKDALSRCLLRKGRVLFRWRRWLAIGREKVNTVLESGSRFFCTGVPSARRLRDLSKQPAIRIPFPIQTKKCLCTRNIAVESKKIYAEM
ncbi:hypothetical protein TNCT_252271 [Trichonephila clavata]|uniref:Uncharacterized protein n=1 Tax=Trichonephila clavata TaxID=2740835 RepID=A0A8X6JED4_TRICU|nr:hypothetical protein TNCT_252271 [Trichonephila clavata]